MTKCKHYTVDVHVVLGDDNEVECIGCGKSWYLRDYVYEAVLAENKRVLDEVEKINNKAALSIVGEENPNQDIESECKALNKIWRDDIMPALKLILSPKEIADITWSLGRSSQLAILLQQKEEFASLHLKGDEKNG